jgi:multidrug transporter EmrE-like cation transporter
VGWRHPGKQFDTSTWLRPRCSALSQLGQDIAVLDGVGKLVRIGGLSLQLMGKRMGYLFLFLALTLNATANILLKVGAARLGVLDEPNLVGRLFANYHLLAGLSLFALNVVFYVLALTRLNLSVAYPIMMAGGVVIIVTVSILLLHEALTIRQTVGLFLLIVGIVLVTERSTA